jgi:hypothetical protein
MVELDVGVSGPRRKGGLCGRGGVATRTGSAMGTPLRWEWPLVRARKRTPWLSRPRRKGRRPRARRAPQARVTHLRSPVCRQSSHGICGCGGGAIGPRVKLVRQVEEGAVVVIRKV